MVQPSKNAPRSQQTSLSSFFSISRASPTNRANADSNVVEPISNDTDTDDEEDNVVVTSLKRSNSSLTKEKSTNGPVSQPIVKTCSRKRIIHDDDDDDNDDESYHNDDNDDESNDNDHEMKNDTLAITTNANRETHSSREAADSHTERMEQQSLPFDDDDTVSIDSSKLHDGDTDMEEEKLTSKKQSRKSHNRKKVQTVRNHDIFDTKSKRHKAAGMESIIQTTHPSNEISSKGFTKQTGTTLSATISKGMKSNTQIIKILTTMMDADADAWTKGKHVPYSALCDTFSLIEAISSRLEIQEKLTELFRIVLLREGGGDFDTTNSLFENNETKQSCKENHTSTLGQEEFQSDLYPLLYLASNSVAPSYECVELGVGDSILIKAISEASGSAKDVIEKKYEMDGDLGTVAQSYKAKQKTLVGFGRMSGPKRLDAKEVLMVFRQIATTSGSKSQKWKVDKIKGLLVRAKGSEAKYIIRGLQGKLRIGLAQSTVLASLAHAVALTRPKNVVPLTEKRLQEIQTARDDAEVYPDFARKICQKSLPLETKLETAVVIVKKAYSEVPSFDSLLKTLLHVPLQEVHKTCVLTPGIPVEPMLAKPTKSVLEVLKRLNGLRFTCEYKYDGERAQVHMTPDGTTKVFSRSLLNTSEKFPEVPLYVQESCKETSVSSFVLDTEVVAFNRESMQFVPFQVLSTRKRTEESASTAKVQVIVQAFDLMYLNGKSLLDRTLAERRQLLRENFVPVEGRFQFATSLDHIENGDTTIIEEFLDNAVKGQCEGLMVKTLDVNAAYEPSRRSLNWLKLKKDYLEGLGDSVDLVPLGAYHGKGKRTGVYGAYLLACYDEDTEEFQSVCKIGTGFSEEDLKELAACLNSSIIPEKSPQYNVSDALQCDVWFDAVQVWEIKAADLSKSSTHKGAVNKTGENGRGIGLRFPRFERIRPDKKPEEATTSDQLLEMYYAQDSVVGNDAGDEEGGI